MIAAHILPSHMLLAEAARQAVEQGLKLVITRKGQCALVPQVLPGMQKICVAVEPDNRRAA